MAFLQRLQRAANDFRPKAPPRAVPFVTLAQKHQRAFKSVVIGLLILVIVMMGTLLWFMHGNKTGTPVAAVATPPVKIIVKLEHDNSHTLIPVSPPASPPPPLVTSDNSADIVLPAESLASAEPPSPEDLAPVPDGDPAVAVVAEKINDLPVITNVSHENPIAHSVVFHHVPALTEEQLLNDAHLLLESGEDQAALGLYNRVLAHDKNSPAALAGKMYSLQRTGQYEDAIEVGHRLLQIDPENADAHANLVTALGQSQLPAAMTELQHIVETNPNDAHARAALARLLVRRGYFEQAFAQLSRAAKLAPDNIFFRLDLAILYDRANHTADAINLYRQVIRAVADQDEPQRLPLSPVAIRQRVEYLEAMLTTPER